jgi:hydrogenase nickel incorporation protein HypA/HybF
MHEFSVVQSLLSTIYRYASQERAKEVTKVVLQFGPLSGIEPHLFKIAFDTFKEGSIAEKADLVLKEGSLQLKCRECDAVTELMRVQFRCEKCSSLRVEVLNGEELILERLEMECP